MHGYGLSADEPGKQIFRMSADCGLLKDLRSLDEFKHSSCVLLDFMHFVSVLIVDFIPYALRKVLISSCHIGV